MENRISTLVGWATQQGAELHPAVEIYEDPITGLSFRVKLDASAPIEAYEPIVRIPTSITLSYVDAITDESGTALRKDFLSAAPPHVIGRVFLIKEYLRGRDSFWWPYIQALPQPDEREAWALPPFWPLDEAELLDGTNVEVGVEKIRTDVKRELKEAEKLLSSCGDRLAPPTLTATLYQWAYCIYSSRSFRPSLVLSEKQREALPAGVSVDDFSVLLPLFDIGNHDMTNEIRWELSHETKTCELHVGRAHNLGQQIFNNYSMKTNAELLLGYGFLIPPTKHLHNDYTHVRKRASNPTASEEYLIYLRPVGDPSSVLGRSKLDPRLVKQAGKTIAAFQHVQPDMVWDIFCTLAQNEPKERLVPVSADELKESSNPSGDVEYLRQEKFLSGNVQGQCLLYLEQTASIIQHKVLQELERLNETDFEVDGDELKMLTRNQRLALQYRERCRQVLEDTLVAMNDDEVLQSIAEQVADENGAEE